MKVHQVISQFFQSTPLVFLKRCQNCFKTWVNDSQILNFVLVVTTKKPSDWWFQPISKILVKLDHFPK